jgi:hypothetical protein
VLIGLLVAIGLALAVVGVVAYPHLREGAPLLTPEGVRLAREARQKAQAMASNAADALVNREREDDPGLSRGPGPALVPGGTQVGGGQESSAGGTRVAWSSPPRARHEEPSRPGRRSGLSPDQPEAAGKPTAAGHPPGPPTVGERAQDAGQNSTGR